MTSLPCAQLAATTISQYARRSYSTRHAPAVILSQPSSSFVSASRSKAASTSWSKLVEYAVALIASIRPVKCGWNVQNAASACSGESASTPDLAVTGMRLAQYSSQTSLSFKIVSFWVLQKGMKAPGSAANAPRCCQPTMQSMSRKVGGLA